MRDNDMELLSFCISAAINCMDEPAIYGPLRLLEVMIQVMESAENPERFGELLDYVREHKTLCMYDEDRFRAALQETGFRLIALQQNE